MSDAEPDRLIDPVCDMTVVVADARAKGLVFEREDRVYAFCSRRCLKDFSSDPARWLSKPEPARSPVSGGPLIIDEGLRHWYASCRCCMHDALPDIVTALDAERKSAKQPVAGAGICEVAEGAESAKSLASSSRA